MDDLIKFLNSLLPEEQKRFAAACETTVGYLRKAASTKQKLGERTVINIERESGGRVRCEVLRPDVDWAYLRGTAQLTPAESSVAPTGAFPGGRPHRSAAHLIPTNRVVGDRRLQYRRVADKVPALVPQTMPLPFGEGSE